MPVSLHDSSRSGRCLPCLETLAAERPKVRPVKEDRTKKARDLTGIIRCRARAPECQRGPQVMALLEIFSNMQHRRFGRVGAVASDGHEHPSLTLSSRILQPKDP